jgi:hypothetical protein
LELKLAFSLDTGSTGADNLAGNKPAIGRTLLRVIALAFGVCSIWAVVGSVLYPFWWYDFFCRGEVFDPLFLKSGYLFLLDIDIWVLMPVPIAGALLAILAWRFWHRVSCFLDRFAVVIITCCLAGISTDALILRHTQKAMYEAFMSLVKVGESSVAATSSLLEIVLPPARIDPPVNFHYLDRPRIEALYSEIQPTLSENERKVSSEKRSGASIDIDRKPASLKADTASGVSETRSYKSVDLSTERKCLEMINSLLMRPSPPYYRTAELLRLSERARESHRLLESLRHEIAAPRSLFTIESDPADEARVDRLRELSKATNSADDLSAGVDAQLHHLSGLVIIEGAFRETRLQNGGARFDEPFAKGVRPVVFSFELRDREAVRLIHGSTNLRVLGDMASSRAGGRSVEILAIAIF